jgi:hypothetical protein
MTKSVGVSGSAWCFAALAVLRSGYFKVSGTGTPIRSKAWRWAAVGSVSMGTSVPEPANRTLAAGQGGQVASRSRKLRQGRPAGRAAEEALVWAPPERRAGATDNRVVPAGPALVGEDQRGPHYAQMPSEVAGEHADQHVDADAFSGGGTPGVRSRSPDLIERKPRSTRARFL